MSLGGHTTYLFSFVRLAYESGKRGLGTPTFLKLRGWLYPGPRGDINFSSSMFEPTLSRDGRANGLNDLAFW